MFANSFFHFQDFLESEGIDVNPVGSVPTDPYIEKRKVASALRTYNTKSDFDKLKQFMEMDRKVLRFYGMWDDRDSMFGEMRPFVLHVSVNPSICVYFIQTSEILSSTKYKRISTHHNSIICYNYLRSMISYFKLS